jgi:hypothetical protein
VGLINLPASILHNLERPFIASFYAEVDFCGQGELRGQRRLGPRWIVSDSKLPSALEIHAPIRVQSHRPAINCKSILEFSNVGHPLEVDGKEI